MDDGGGGVIFEVEDRWEFCLGNGRSRGERVVGSAWIDRTEERLFIRKGGINDLQPSIAICRSPVFSIAITDKSSLQ